MSHCCLALHVLVIFSKILKLNVTQSEVIISLRTVLGLALLLVVGCLWFG